MSRRRGENAIAFSDRIRYIYINNIFVFFEERILRFFKIFTIIYIGHTAQVCLLLKHRADQHIEDESGIKPLSIAVKEANADIVTL